MPWRSPKWHESHQRCAKCGSSTHFTFGGAVRECDSCGASHHPRTDPAIIVLVKDAQDRILLGRQKVWPANVSLHLLVLLNQVNHLKVV